MSSEIPDEQLSTVMLRQSESAKHHFTEALWYAENSHGNEEMQSFVSEHVSLGQTFLRRSNAMMLAASISGEIDQFSTNTMERNTEEALDLVSRIASALNLPQG